MAPEAVRTSLASKPDQSSEESTPEPEQDSSAGHDEPERSEELPLDVIFELLQNQRRRRVLRHLEGESGSSDLGTLAESIAAKENDKSVKALTSSERKRVYICLYQCHLPKLDDAGIIEFDSNRGTVERTELTAQLTTYLDRLKGSRSSQSAPDRSWPARYFGITFVGGGLYFLQAAMFPSAVLAHVLVGVLVATLLVSSAIHATLP